MMQQKDSLIEKLSYVFKEKDSIITQLQLKINDTTYDDQNFNENAIVTTKQAFKQSPERRNSESESDKSMRSLAYLMQKTK